MLDFSVRPLTTAEAADPVIACLEILAFFLGEATVGDLEIDEDLASAWYVREIVSSEDKENYEAEPQMAVGEMAEWFEAELATVIRSRAATLGHHYPFDVSQAGFLKLTRKDRLTTVSLCYLTLQFYTALVADYLELNDDRSRASFLRNFERLFEFIAGYSVAGSEGGYPFMTSDCRSADQLHEVLTRMCREIGSGEVHDLGSWGAVHLETNDGKVDCLVQGFGHNGGAPRMFLVGATLQRSGIEAKIMNNSKLAFFSGFFRVKPAAFQGVLVRAHGKHDLTKYKCDNENCILYTYEDVWRGLAHVPLGRSRTKALRYLELNARDTLVALRTMKLTHMGGLFVQPISCGSQT